MNKEILRLAIPNIISNISIPLLSTVDTILMGQLSARHLGAVGIGAMIYNFLYWNLGFLRMGTTGITAQAYGKEDPSEIIHTLGRGMMVALLLSVLILLLAYPIQLLSFVGFNVLENQEALVSDYFYIRLLAVPAGLSLMVFNGWFFGMQNAYYPLIITVVANVINIGLSFYLVRHLNMETKGVALGTVIAQYLSTAIAMALIYKSYSEYFSAFRRNLLLQVDTLKRFLSINIDIFIRTVFLTLAFAFFYSQSSRGGELILAVNVVLLQLVNWMSYGVDGFAFAAESMVGKYKGADNKEKLNASIKLALIWGGLFAAIYSLVYLIGYENIISLFTKDEAVIETSLKFRIWMVLFPLAGFLCYIWDGIYIGLTASKAMRNACFWSFVVYLVIYYSTVHALNEHAVWLALFVFLIGRGLIQSYLFRLKGAALK